MMTYNLNEAKPFIAIPVGEYILDELKARKMTQKELAAALGIPASRVNEAIKGVNTMTGSITDTSDNMNSMLTDNSQSLTDAVEKMNNIDFDGLNKAIQDLQDAVGPFASLMKKF